MPHSNDAASELHDLRFGVSRSIRYHDRRIGFYDRWHTLTNAVSVIFATAIATTTVLYEGNWALILFFGGLVTLFSTIDLVVGTSRMARRHERLRNQFISLDQEINRGAAGADQDQVIGWSNQRLEIEKEEPPVLHILNLMCHNDELRASGYSLNDPKDQKEYAKLKWYHRLLAQWIDLGADSIR